MLTTEALFTFKARRMYVIFDLFSIYATTIPWASSEDPGSVRAKQNQSVSARFYSARITMDTKRTLLSFIGLQL